MAKKKITFTELKVKSFSTALDEEQMNHVKGGLFMVRGRRVSYRTRWTSVDTRSDEIEKADLPHGD